MLGLLVKLAVDLVVRLIVKLVELGLVLDYGRLSGVACVVGSKASVQVL